MVALSEPPSWKRCSQKHPHNPNQSSLERVENIAFNGGIPKPCRCFGVAPDLRLTTDPRPRLHTPESVRRANAARLIAAQLQAYAAVPAPKSQAESPTASSRGALWGALVAWSLGLLTGIMLSQLG